MFEALEKKVASKAGAVAPQSSEARPPTEPPEAPPTQGAEGEPDQPPAAPAGEAAPKGEKRISPWKLLDQFKDRTTKAEARVLELEKLVPSEQQRKESAERMTAAEKRMAEMQEDLRWYNAEKYDPEILKANQEYESAWKRAITELNEITVSDANGEQRPMTTNDLLELVNMPLGRAREIADQLFGPFADDVMAHRKEIKRVFDAKMAKLEDLRTNGAKRDQDRQTQYRAAVEQFQNMVKTTWDKANQEAHEHPEYGAFFKPKEGDEEWNTRLKKGFELVDTGLAINITDPRLTNEQRQELVRKHAAIRNRAASWGALRYENSRLQATIAKLEKELKGYKESAQGTGGQRAPAPNAAGGRVRAFDQMVADLQKIAH